MGQSESAKIKGLIFTLGEDGKTLQAIGTSPDAKQKIDLPAIKAALAERGFGKLFLFDKAVADLIKKYNAATTSFTLNIGERRDGTVTVTVSTDRMTANLTITPPFGGKAVDRQQVNEAIKAAGVVSGILDQEIDAALALGEVTAKPIALGQPPENGKDAEFQSLIPDIKERHPRIDENGISDYRELDKFITVQKGDPLMRRVPATAGVAGKSVLGGNLTAKFGKDTHFASGLKGAVVDPQDHDLLVADITGQAVLVNNGIMVEPVITVKNVDLSTGNLDFEGSIHVQNDVMQGMKIRATGDVIIGGIVESSEIEAGGDISIRGGILGRVEASEDEDKVHRNTARIRCGGSLSARFIENAWIEAGNCIAVESEVKRSVLTAINQVIIGKRNGKKGHVIGGATRATLLVQMLVVGSPAGVPTKIEVGVNPLIKSKIDAVTRQLQAIEKKREETTHIISYAANHPQQVSPEALNKAQRDDEKFQIDIANCIRERDTLQAQLNLADNAKVSVAQRIYGGVQIRIGQKLRLINEERIGGVLQLRDGEVFINDA